LTSKRFLRSSSWIKKRNKEESGRDETGQEQGNKNRKGRRKGTADEYSLHNYPKTTTGRW